MPCPLLPAHPRSRGENGSAFVMPVISVGSSPLTRGKLVLVPGPAREVRLIPAHAGKTCSAWSLSRCRPAHPRSRGENRERRPDRLIVDGSSPLTRGKLWRDPPPRRDRRLIPAHAGKTLSDSARDLLKPAHPRSRGENGRFRRVRAGRFGSSPLTRGNGIGVAVAAYWGGSSPLTRGKRDRRCQAVGQFRLIPAHAGKTWGQQYALVSVPAHPRSRGENYTRFSA